LGKIQDKRNHNNQNVKWISIEARDDGRNINIITQGVAKIGTGVIIQYTTQQQWVKKNIEPHK
jgi:hypothetical protein